MIKTQTLKLLLCGVSDGDSDRIISQFRRAGFAARHLNIDDGDALSDALKQSWDLLIYDAERAQLDIAYCASLLGREPLDLPLLYLDSCDPLEPPNPVISSCCRKDDGNQFIQLALLEIGGLHLRRELAERQTALDEIAQRNSLLLDAHQDALCYFTDGMIIRANAAFCEQFGHEQLDGFPVVDLIANRDQERFKNILRRQAKGEDQKFSISMLHSNGEDREVSVALSSAKYDGEDCVQFALLETQTAQSSGIDNMTGLLQYDVFHLQLQTFLENERNSGSTVLLFALDDYPALRKRVGISGAQDALAHLATVLRHSLTAQAFGRIGDNMIAALAHHVAGDRALEMANEVCRKVQAEILEIDRQSLQYTTSAVVLPINHLTTAHADQQINSLARYVLELSDSGGNAAEIYQRERQQLQRDESVAALVSEAMADNRLHMLYQPVINLGDAVGDYYETSLGIQDWTEGEVTAGELLREVERDPTNNTLDRWILVEATKQLAKSRLTGQDVRLIINLSCNVFHDDEFCGWLAVALKAAGIPGNALTLQFNEQSIVNALKPAQSCYKQLKSMHIGFGVRNFGRLEPANQFLHTLRPSIVKPSSRASDAILADDIRESVRNARTLNSRIIIPHVASAATLAMLWQLGPDFIQGSYIQEPAPNMDYSFAQFS